MKNTTHTPGPWFCHSGMVWAQTTPTSDGTAIARMARDEERTSPTERDANAALIAAAPAMLEALEKCFNVIDYVTAERLADFIGVDEVTDAYQAARAAIARARKVRA